MTSNEVTSDTAAIDRQIAWVTPIAEAIDESAATASEVVDDAAQSPSSDPMLAAGLRLEGFR